MLEDLKAEWSDLVKTRQMDGRVDVGTRERRKGGTAYFVSCSNGYHESAESHEHAFSLLVESFRTRAEDRPETYEKLLGKNGDVKAARQRAMQIAQTVRKANPMASPEEWDKLVVSEIEKRNSDQSVELAQIAKLRELDALKKAP